MNIKKSFNHYEKWVEEWQQRFLSLNQEELLKKLQELKEEGDDLTIRHFGRKYAIHRHNGALSAPGGTETPSLSTKLNIYTLLWYCSPTAFPSGEWVPFYRLKDASPFASAFQKSILDVLSSTFSGHTEKFVEACEALGGRRLPLADVSYELKAFECILLQFLFWEGDDEFPAQANILFDKNAVHFIHVESVVTIASEGVGRLAEAAGLPLKGSPFTKL